MDVGAWCLVLPPPWRPGIFCETGCLVQGGEAVKMNHILFRRNELCLFYVTLHLGLRMAKRTT